MPNGMPVHDTIRTGEHNSFYGKHHTLKTRAILSLKAKARPSPVFTEEHKDKISAALTGRKASPEHKEHNRLSHIGQKHTEEWKITHSRQLKGRPLSQSHKDAISRSTRGKHKVLPPFTEQHRKRIGEANHRRWQIPGFAEIVLPKIRGAIRPNKVEQLLTSLLDEYFPKEWRYVGNGKLIIEKKNPDFINCNGQKAVIELFGDYWHGRDEEREKIEFYRAYGFDCLVIWQSELNAPEAVVNKIRRFSAHAI